MLFTPLLAQAGSQAAADIIQDALTLAQRTRESWQETWDIALQIDDVSLWGAIVRFSLGISALALIYLAIRQGNEIAKSKSWGALIDMFIFPILTIFVLGGNGRILSAMVLALRGVGYQMIDSILSISLGGVTLLGAIQAVNTNGLLMRRIQQLFQECDTIVGAELTACFQQKTVEAQTIIEQFSGDLDIDRAQAFLNTIVGFVSPASGAAGVVGEVTGGVLEGIGDGAGVGQAFEQAFVQVLQDRIFPIIDALLYAVQWAVVNIMEASLLLTALFAPVAIALSLIPIAGRVIFGWMAGFIAILGVKLGYNILIGLMAFVMANTDTAGLGEVASDLGFLVFAAIFAPSLALLIGRGGGLALYQGISRQAAFLVDALRFIVSETIRAVR